MLTNLIEYILNYKSISSFIIFAFYLLLLLIFFLRKNQRVAERIRQKGFELSRYHSYNERAKYLLKIISSRYVG